MTLNILTHPEKMKSHRRCQGRWLSACKNLFPCLITAFHQHLVPLFHSELATAQVTMLLQLIRISKMWSDQKENLKRNHLPQKSADAVARDGAPISSPPYIHLISQDVFLSLINMPFTEEFHHALLMLLPSADSQRQQAPQGAVMAALVTYASHQCVQP